jgi:hypothetical protein
LPARQSVIEFGPRRCRDVARYFYGRENAYSRLNRPQRILGNGRGGADWGLSPIGSKPGNRRGQWGRERKCSRLLHFWLYEKTPLVCNS